MRLKKSVAYKKTVCFVATSSDARSCWCESVFNLFSVPSWIWSCFCIIREKISFSTPDFVDSEIGIGRLTSLTDFYEGAHLLFKKRNMSDCQKKISFFSNNAPEIHIFNSWGHQKLLLISTQLLDSTFFFN